MRKWVQREVSGLEVTQLIAELDIHRILARVLVARGINTPEKAASYLAPAWDQLPDPGALAGMSEACTRFTQAILEGEKIGIFGDYDVDGVTSSVILSEFLEDLGASVYVTLPNRLTEGYGLSKAGLERLEQAGVRLIITVDCGITAHEEIDLAKSKNMDVVVVDHHTVPVQLPNAVAVINPHRSDCQRSAEHLCAAGVVFNLCMALRKHLRAIGFFQNRPEPNLLKLVDLVALGTVADVVPLIQENRVFVQKGLELIQQGTRPGIKALLAVANIELSKVNSGTLGFQLGPRINAAGRLENAMSAVKLLRMKELESAWDLAEQLNTSNEARRDLEKQITETALSEIAQLREHQEALINIIAHEEWHPGVVGIVASRLVEKTGKPTIVIGQKGKGSGRSIPGFHLHEALCAVQDTLLGFGGHAHAVGVQIDFNFLGQFQRALRDYAAKKLKPEDLFPVIYYDGELALEDIDESLVRRLSQAAPFGRSNPEPVFYLRQIRVRELRELKGGHIRGLIEGKNLEFIAFGLAEKAHLLKNPVDLLGTPDLNTWQAKNTLQLRVKDLKA